MIKPINTSTLAYNLSCRMAEHIRECETHNARVVLNAINLSSPTTLELIHNLEEAKDKALEHMVRGTRNTEASEEIYSACSDLLYRARRA